MDNHVGKSQKWQEWQGREIISVNIDRGLSARQRIGSGVVKAHKQRVKELEEDLRPSYSSRDSRQPERPTNERKPEHLVSVDFPEETQKPKSVKKKQRKKVNVVASATNKIVSVQPLPPIKRGIQSQTSDPEITKATNKNMVARKAIAATNLYDTRNVSCKDELLFPDLVDYGLHDNASLLSTVLESPCTQGEATPERFDADSKSSSNKRNCCARKKRFSSSSICYNCAKRDTPIYLENDITPGTSNQDILSPPVEVWRNGTPVSPVVFSRNAKPISNKNDSMTILKFYRDNYPLLLSTLQGTRDLPCMPVKCFSPLMVQRLSHRVCPKNTLREFETNEDEDVTKESEFLRMRLDIKKIKKMLKKERKKHSKQ